RRDPGRREPFSHRAPLVPSLRRHHNRRLTQSRRLQILRESNQWGVRMSRFAEDVAARIARSLSVLFEKKLTIVDAASADAARSIALTSDISLQLDDGIGPVPRHLVNEIGSLVRFATDRDRRVHELNARLA